MKKSIILILSLVLLVNYSVSAQSFSCGTETPVTPLNYTSLARMQSAKVEMEPICINVAFHVVQTDDGTDNHPVKLQEIIDRLNSDYASTNISFAMTFNGQKEAFDVIKNSNYLDILERGNSNPFNFDNLVAINHDAQAINVYLVDRMHTVFNFEVQGRGIIPSRKLVIMKTSATKAVISHEMGHCLNLEHTHRVRKERINGVLVEFPETADNCTYEGDYICDTPPDPDLSQNHVNSKCEYINPVAGYDNPDIENIMSYSLENCLNHFTEGQALRMYDAILNNEDLKTTINCNCTGADLGLLGSSNLCFGQNTTYTIPCASGISKIKKTDNLDVTTVTNSTITISPNKMSGEATLTVLLANGQAYTKHFWIGIPSVDLKITSQVNYVFMELIPLESDFDTQKVSYIKWETLSSSSEGFPYMGTAVNQFENMARGTTTNWTIEARIHVGNECETAFLNKTIQPEASEPCGREYEVNRVSEKEFAIFKIINPCEERTTKEKVKNEDIRQAVLLDMFGNQVRTYQGNNFNVENIKEGVYLFKIQIGNGLVTQKIIID